jgi:hypothetical protein
MIKRMENTNPRFFEVRLACHRDADSMIIDWSSDVESSLAIALNMANPAPYG